MNFTSIAQNKIPVIIFRRTSRDASKPAAMSKSSCCSTSSLGRDTRPALCSRYREKQYLALAVTWFYINSLAKNERPHCNYLKESHIKNRSQPQLIIKVVEKSTRCNAIHLELTHQKTYVRIHSNKYLIKVMKRLLKIENKQAPPLYYWLCD